MKFKHHIIIGLIGSYFLTYLFQLSFVEGLTIFLASILIDTDHYFWYTFSSKNPNPIKAVKWYLQAIPKWKKMTLKQKNNYKRGVYIFHGIEFWIILILLSFYNKIFLFIFFGIMLHIIPDVSYLIWKRESPFLKISQFYVLRRNKKKKSLKELWKI